MKRAASSKRNTSSKETNVKKTVSVQKDKKGTTGSQPNKDEVKSKPDSNRSYGELLVFRCQFCICYLTTFTVGAKAPRNPGKYIILSLWNISLYLLTSLYFHRSCVILC